MAITSHLVPYHAPVLSTSPAVDRTALPAYYAYTVARVLLERHDTPLARTSPEAVSPVLAASRLRNWLFAGT
jgi:hypothetical protein